MRRVEIEVDNMGNLLLEIEIICNNVKTKMLDDDEYGKVR